MKSFTPVPMIPISGFKYQKQTLLSRFPRLRKTKYESEKKSSLSNSTVLNVLRKCIYRTIFRKFRLLIKSFCTTMNSFLLQYISPRLSKLVRGRTNNVEVMFRLSGKTWPPMIVYSAKITNIKLIGFDPEESETKRNSWRMLFTDAPLNEETIETPSSRYGRYSPALVHPSLPYHHRGIRGRKSDRRSGDLEASYHLNKPSLIKDHSFSKPFPAFKRSASSQKSLYRKNWEKIGTIKIQWQNLNKSNIH
ncbi:unnamed protein product [Blepharisma stoltei]|uniref:Ribosomal protein S4 n=1 Tax=Blepharisma stoltei TaxID=1481888 RepID=A0AAU9JMZ5_9CILI|nr:unnamed protein product [Blepharisma stoltei]